MFSDLPTQVPIAVAGAEPPQQWFVSRWRRRRPLLAIAVHPGCVDWPVSSLAKLRFGVILLRFPADAPGEPPGPHGSYLGCIDRSRLTRLPGIKVKCA